MSTRTSFVNGGDIIMAPVVSRGYPKEPKRTWYVFEVKTITVCSTVIVVFPVAGTHAILEVEDNGEIRMPVTLHEEKTGPAFVRIDSATLVPEFVLTEYNKLHLV